MLHIHDKECNSVVSPLVMRSVNMRKLSRLVKTLPDHPGGTSEEGLIDGKEEFLILPCGE